MIAIGGVILVDPTVVIGILGFGNGPLPGPPDVGEREVRISFIKGRPNDVVNRHLSKAQLADGADPFLLELPERDWLGEFERVGAWDSVIQVAGRARAQHPRPDHRKAAATGLQDRRPPGSRAGRCVGAGARMSVGLALDYRAGSDSVSGAQCTRIAPARRRLDDERAVPALAHVKSGRRLDSDEILGKEPWAHRLASCVGAR